MEDEQTSALHTFRADGPLFTQEELPSENEELPVNDQIEEETEGEGNPNAEIPQPTPKKSRHRVCCLNIIGQIEGHTILPPQQKTTKYEHVIPQLTVVEEDESIEGLLITLNTVGGDVEAGLAIAEMISTMSKPTVSLITGGGHSIGVPLAVSADYSIITQSATMTLHPIRMTGLVIGATQTYEYFNKVQEQVMHFIERNSKIKRTQLKRLMQATGQISNDIGTILFGHEAVEKGIIDAVGGVRDAFDKLYEFIEARPHSIEHENQSDKKS